MSTHRSVMKVIVMKVCTGLEALVHTDPNANTRQFAVRVPRLASEFGVGISESEARDAYDLRSQLAHGLSFLATATTPAPSPAQLHLYDRLEDTLRAAVLRGMRDNPSPKFFVTALKSANAGRSHKRGDQFTKADT